MPVDPMTAGMIKDAAGSYIQTAVGAGQAIGGLIQSKKARAELESLERPFYEIQDEILQNRNLAANQAQMGVPQATKDYLTEETGRGLSSSIGAIKQTGASGNAVADLFQAYQRGLQSNAAMDAQARVANLSNFMAENEKVAGQKITQFSINEFQPFQDKVQMLQARIGQGNQNLSSGLNNVLGGVSSASVSNQNQDLINTINNLSRGGGNNTTSTGGGGMQPNIDMEALAQALRTARGQG